VKPIGPDGAASGPLFSIQSTVGIVRSMPPISRRARYSCAFPRLGAEFSRDERESRRQRCVHALHVFPISFDPS
jgi:hypothetical protein